MNTNKLNDIMIKKNDKELKSIMNNILKKNYNVNNKSEKCRNKNDENESFKNKKSLNKPVNKYENTNTNLDVNYNESTLLGTCGINSDQAKSQTNINLKKTKESSNLETKYLKNVLPENPKIKYVSDIETPRDINDEFGDEFFLKSSLNAENTLSSKIQKRNSPEKVYNNVGLYLEKANNTRNKNDIYIQSNEFSSKEVLKKV